MTLITSICEDCGAPVADGARFCPASEEAACVERTLRRYGGDRLLARAAAADMALDDALADEMTAEFFGDADSDDSDDLAAHLRETVDELRRGE